MSEQRKSEFGIWKKSIKLKTGQVTEVLSFSVNGQRYTAWPNTRKQNERSPDYNVYVDNYVKPDQSTAQPVAPAAPTPTANTEGFSDLPF